MRKLREMFPVVLGLTLVLVAGGCGDDTSPNPSRVIIKAQTKSGDQQTGPVGVALIDELRVQVTLNGVPEEGATVTWSTATGTLDPASSQTDVDGIAVTSWTLGPTAGSQTATATLSGATGSPLTFTATAESP
ncbi:MAG: Ig-like domain-containing protein [Gemmatimonadales bacterium]